MQTPKLKSISIFIIALSTMLNTVTTAFIAYSLSRIEREGIYVHKPHSIYGKQSKYESYIKEVDNRKF